MTEATLTQMHDAIAETNDFLFYERGETLDGAGAASSVEAAVITVEQQAHDLLFAQPFPNKPGYYVPLSMHNASQFELARQVLPGYAVLVPSVIAGYSSSEFFPAIVSEDSAKREGIRLHILCQPYRNEMLHGTSVTLSGVGQSETTGVGVSHGATEPEHLATLLAASDDATVRARWERGDHINHEWRDSPTSSVVSEVSNRLFKGESPRVTKTISRADIDANRAILLWHEGLRNTVTGKPETATRTDALVILQGLGFQALKKHKPQAIDDLKSMLQK